MKYQIKLMRCKDNKTHSAALIYNVPVWLLRVLSNVWSWTLEQTGSQRETRAAVVAFSIWRPKKLFKIKVLLCERRTDEERAKDKPAAFKEISGPRSLHFACNSSSNAALAAVFSFNPVTDYHHETDVKFIMNTFYIIPHPVTE